jgi:mycothiol synthase
MFTSVAYVPNLAQSTKLLLAQFEMLATASHFQVLAKRLLLTNVFNLMRHILKLHRSFLDPVPQASNNFEISTFLPSTQKEEWLALNNRIFAKHPDQGNWGMADLDNRMAENWFDPEGFFIAMENQKMVGFCWMKIHHDFVNQDPIGEIYVIGVDPENKKTGLGKALAITGLNYLNSKSLKQAMLYVDADNAPALAMYQGLGFN